MPKKTMPKCDNCKFAGHNYNRYKKKKSVPNDMCCRPRWDKNGKFIPSWAQYTTNSKHFTHCDKHEFQKQLT